MADAFARIRDGTEHLAHFLSPEDMCVQAFPDASPTKWHLAHTTWFFEEFLLKEFEANFSPFNDSYSFLFNSYYEQVGPRWKRADRGLISRPSVVDVLDYRRATTERVHQLIYSLSESVWDDAARILELGLHHEQQHQELIMTDIKAALSLLPGSCAAFPAPHFQPRLQRDQSPPHDFLAFDGGLMEFGSPGGKFHFDNEGPPIKVYLEDFSLATRCVTNGEYRSFIDDGGYKEATLWLSDGWAWVNENDISLPLYWRETDDGLEEYTLHGLKKLDDLEPVTHLSAYEAFAYAEWSGHRLPTEFELELACRLHPSLKPQFLDPQKVGTECRLHPVSMTHGDSAFAGQVWAWTSSAYSAYPGFRPEKGAIGEYNGKFMSSQLVLRGGSCFTPEGHWRPSYRNFMPPDARWQMSGLRLAR
ncbi:MAG: ergothioneine biosynthesis protein EgtB [Pseudomonadota bacterium]